VFLSQGLWFALPVVAKVLVAPEKLGPFGAQSASFTFIWISLMHGLQYLWITNYYVKKERPGSTAPRFLAKSLLMGTALYGIPVLLLAPLLAGRASFDGGLELMLAAALNIHHIVLDSAIWKLRNARVAKILIRGADMVADVATPQRLHWVRAVVLVSGVLGVTFALWSASERRNGVQIATARGDVERLEKAARRMSWMGRDSAATRSQLGFLLGESGDSARAIAEFERSIAIEPNAVAWTNIGALQEREGNIAEALSAYDSALALDPDDLSALQYAARVLIKTGRPDRARPLLERAMTLAPERSDIRDLFEEATQG
jgi:tetratricopeptide (TPR) repeat protein